MIYTKHYSYRLKFYLMIICSSPFNSYYPCDDNNYFIIVSLIFPNYRFWRHNFASNFVCYDFTWITYFKEIFRGSSPLVAVSNFCFLNLLDRCIVHDKNPCPLMQFLVLAPLESNLNLLFQIKNCVNAMSN